jgi:surface protein
VMVVDTSKAGSASDAFQFTGALGDYDVVAKQSGVAVETFSNLSGQQTITFSNGIGIYTLEVTPKATGGFNRIEFNNSGDKLKITDITSWGNIAWSSFENAFRGASNLTGTYTDKPNLQNLTNMSLMFFQASSFNGNVTNWDVSNINTMRAMFRDCFVLNPNTSNWDVSKCYRYVSNVSRNSTFNCKPRRMLSKLVTTKLTIKRSIWSRYSSIYKCSTIRKEYFS